MIQCGARRLCAAALITLVTLAQGVAAQAAERIVSLAPSLTEIVVQLGAAERLVGVLDAGPRPTSLKAVPSVGRYGQLDIERLLLLKPDLLLLWPASVSAAQREQLARLNIPTFVAEPHSLDELGGQLQIIGQRIGLPGRGAALATDFAQRLAEVRRRYHRDPPTRVFYQLWDSPLYTIGGQQIITDAIAACGGRNVFAELALPAPQVSIEAVLLKDPQVILVPSEGQRTAWNRWPQVAAVKARQVLLGDPALERPSGAMIDAVEHLCRGMAG